MSRNHKEADDLSDAEKRDLMALIQQGKPPGFRRPVIPAQAGIQAALRYGKTLSDIMESLVFVTHA